VNKNIFLLLTFVSLSAAQGEPSAPNPSASPAATADRQHVQIVTDLNPAPSPTESSKFDSSLLGGTNPVLTEQERAGVNITQAWKDKSFETLVSQPGANSSVEFRFGESLPTIVCAILQVTDIELQAGEGGHTHQSRRQHSMDGGICVIRVRFRPGRAFDRKAPRYRALNVAGRHNRPAHVPFVAGERRNAVHA
jgi:hypothetical protein